MAGIGDAFVDVRADTSGFQRDLNQGVTKSTQGASKEMGGLRSNVAAVGAAAKVFIAGAALKAVGNLGAMANQAIDSYQNLNESINAVNVTFGENADEINNLGRAAAQNLGLSNAEFNSLAVSTSAFVESISEGLGQDVPSVVDDLTVRIGDFASVMNLDVADAFDKFRSGLAGESEPLRKFGIDVSAAKIEQVALAEGIIETGEAMTEAEKVTARYLTIMEQTEKTAGDFANTSEELANATRIANAEIENNRAMIGEALVPWRQFTTGVGLQASRLIGSLATDFGVLTGKIDPAVGAAQQFQLITGEQADSAAAAATIVKEYGTSFSDLIPTLDLSRDELEKLLGVEELLMEQHGFSAEQVEDLSAIVGLQLTGAHTDAESAARDHFRAQAELEGGTDSLADAEDELTTELEAATAAMKAQHDQIKGNLDPMFNLSSRTQAVADAQADVTAALDEFGEGSPEHIAAVEDLAQANLDLKIAEDEARVAVDLTRDAFIEQQVELGLTREEAELLADSFEDLERFKFSPKDIRINFTGPGGSVAAREGGVISRQHGGPVGAGQMALVGEAGPELFVPKVAGQVISNNNLTQMGGTVEIVNHFTGTDAAQAQHVARVIAEQAVEALSRKRVVQ